MGAGAASSANGWDRVEGKVSSDPEWTPAGAAAAAEDGGGGGGGSVAPPDGFPAERNAPPPVTPIVLLLLPCPVRSSCCCCCCRFCSSCCCRKRCARADAAAACARSPKLPFQAVWARSCAAATSAAMHLLGLLPWSSQSQSWSSQTPPYGSSHSPSAPLPLVAWMRRCSGGGSGVVAQKRASIPSKWSASEGSTAPHWQYS
mmetsp:Transcript_11798/g.30937  ORF Transcript_11798/g.30937 Transcript_11798/m.30937 type:complete len:202 (-) Transcript_11798:487-1092(-)